MQSFVYTPLAQRVVFGTGTLAAAGEELARLGCVRALVLSTPQQAESARSLAKALGNASVGVFANATMHTPVEVTTTAVAEAQRLDADCLISLGGGSTTGLGKAIALRTGLPQVAIPTTYAGSEATPILGQTDKGRKTTERRLELLPDVILYDVDLTLSLPVGLSTTSGLNAIAHAVEARYSREANPVISLLALESIRALARSLPAITASPRDRDARSDALYGAWAAGTCLGAVGMALHHKICHVLGGSFNLPHAETHAVVLPHAVAYNDAAAADVLAPIAQMFNAPSAGLGIYGFSKSIGAPTRLSDIGMPHDGLDRAADEVVASPYWNPRPVERPAIRQLLEDAFSGTPPRPN